MLNRFFTRLFTTRIGKPEQLDGLRALFGDACPLCGRSLAGHCYGVVASFAFPQNGAPPTDDCRARVLTAVPTTLPREPAPRADALQYFLLECPKRRELAAFEAVSRLELFASDSIARITSASMERLEELQHSVERWTRL